jgi:hypothetical protein
MRGKQLIGCLWIWIRVGGECAMYPRGIGDVILCKVSNSGMTTVFRM